MKLYAETALVNPANCRPLQYPILALKISIKTTWALALNLLYVVKNLNSVESARVALKRLWVACRFLLMVRLARDSDHLLFFTTVLD